MKKKKKQTKPWILRYWYLPTSQLILLIGIILYISNLETAGLITSLIGAFTSILAIIKAKSVAVDGKYLM